MSCKSVPDTPGYTAQVNDRDRDAFFAVAGQKKAKVVRQLLSALCDLCFRRRRRRPIAQSD